VDVWTIRETVIKPKLIEVFGTAIGNFLLTNGIVAGMQGSTEEEKLRLTVESICSDPRAVGMWGKVGAEKQKQEWFGLL
jgi:hypothetical protein